MTTDKPDPAAINAAVTRNVRAQLELAGMKHNELAAAADRPVSWVADRLNNRADWRISDLTVVARAIGCPTVTLVTLPEVIG